MRSVSLCIWCCCLLAVINGQIKPIVQCENKYSSVLRIIMMLDNIFDYNNFIIYDNFYAEEGQSDGSSFIQHILTKFKKSVIIAGPETDSLHNLISTRNLAVVFFSGNSDPILDVVANTMRRLPYLPQLFVYKSENNFPLNVKAIEAFFKWCWKSHLYYVTLISNKTSINEIWSYNFKSNLTIYKMTEQKIRNFNKASLGQMQRYQSTVSVYQSVPDVFVYESTDQRDITGGNKSLGGGMGIMIAELMRYVNGTMRIFELPSNNLTVTKSEFRINNITIDIDANMQWKTNVSHHSPFILISKYCMVVPYKRKMGFEKYLLQVYSNWTIISIFIFYIIANVVIKKLNHQFMPLDEILFRSMEICCTQPICDRIIRNMRIAEKIMMICTMIYNLLMFAIFSGALATHITTGFHMPEIVDVDSFLANDLRIMLPTSQQKHILRFETVPKEIENRMVFVDEKTYNHHLNSLNDNFVYIVAAHKWVLYEFVQKRLRQPKLKMASDPLCGISRYLKLPIRPELPLTIKLSNFLDHVHETGLNLKWMRIGLQQMKKANLIKQHPYDPPTHLRLPLEFFMSTFKFLLSGLTMSLVVFLFECIFKRCRAPSNEENNVIIV